MDCRAPPRTAADWSGPPRTGADRHGLVRTAADWFGPARATAVALSGGKEIPVSTGSWVVVRRTRGLYQRSKDERIDGELENMTTLLDWFV